MPRENRKRGKKHSKQKHDTVLEPHAPQEHAHDPQAGPSWIVSASDPSEANREAPFGYVDAEVKAYFRTVDLQIREWQDEGHGAVGGEEDVDPNEDRRLFFVAALTEMSDKEKQLATDPDCSAILERMAYSMDDFVRRVFVDRLSGSFEQLLKHRFASHVCQTLLAVASDTVSREARGIFPPAPESSEAGELRTMTQLVLDLCEELLPTFSSLIMDPFASHVVRALLILLAPDCIAASDGPSNRAGPLNPSVRSKKSAAYKARQGPMKSVFADGGAQPQTDAAKRVPDQFRAAAAKFVLALQEQFGESEVRALAANQVASPVLQLLLEVEAGRGLADAPDSLMDRALVGLITLAHADTHAAPDASDYLATLLRDPTASHLLETLVRRSPAPVFAMLWRAHFEGRLAKLAVHPVANFVVARALERVGAAQLDAACAELDAAWGRIIKTARTGVLRALVDRAAALKAHEDQVTEAIYRAFELESPEERLLLVHCVLRVKTLPDYQAAMSAKAQQPAELAQEPPRTRGRADADADPLEPKTQGAVLLQSMLRLPAPHNEPVLKSICALSADELLLMAHHATSSRVLDAVLDAPAVPPRAKRALVLALLGRFHALVDDRIGSRVGDRCWAYADPYLKEKIARALLPHERFLAGSFYGKFFARHLHLHLLRRSPDEWKTLQASKGLAPAPPPAAPATAETASAARPKKRRKARPEDEIDALFDAAPAKKSRKGGPVSATGDTAAAPQHAEQSAVALPEDTDLRDVLGAIRTAPKDDKRHHKKKRAH